jgi:hypothetical protein
LNIARVSTIPTLQIRCSIRSNEHHSTENYGVAFILIWRNILELFGAFCGLVKRYEVGPRGPKGVRPKRQASDSARVRKPRTRDGEPTGRLDRGRLAAHPEMARLANLRWGQGDESTLGRWGQEVFPLERMRMLLRQR